MSTRKAARRIVRPMAARVLLVLIALAFTGCAKKEAATDQSAATTQATPAAPTAPVSVNVPAAAVARASAPAAPTNATKKTSIGSGATAVNTSSGDADSDMSWVEQMDIDGDGTVEDVTLLWDDEDKVMYYQSTGDFTCSGGGTANGDMLVAVYGEGNTDGVPAGSGWYLVTVDESECAAAQAGAYGCSFDASGNETACGLADIDENTDDLTIVTATP